MALRATESDVQGILQDEDAEVIHQLILANQVVDEMLVGQNVSSAMLKQIEILLACHFYALSDPTPIREEYGGARYEYERVVDAEARGFSATRYGKQAIALDTSGTLKNATKTPLKIYVL